jgi:hypothetical protein
MILSYLELSAIADRTLVALTPGSLVPAFDDFASDGSDVSIRAKRFRKLGDGKGDFLATIFA